MGFLSYSLNYFTNEIMQIEASRPSQKTIYHARQLLKMLDDLLDEGYVELNDALESSCQGVSRLRNYLKVHYAAPFSNPYRELTEAKVRYDSSAVELTKAIQTLVDAAKGSQSISNEPFLSELARFCAWVGYKENIAYIFLLRDTLLPYIYYQNMGRANIYSWLLGRKTLAQLTDSTKVDDELRASIYKALELGKSNSFEQFCKAVLPDMRATLKQYPKAEKCLTKLLDTVRSKQIIVIEAGCSGTFPMLLRSLDERVEVRMYTTYPYLLKAYGNRIYSPQYEKNRLFETLYSQDLYMQFAALEENHFYVRTCCSDEVKNRSYAEIRKFLEIKNPIEI